MTARDWGKALHREFIVKVCFVFHTETTPVSVDSSTSGSEGSSNQVRFQDPLCTIHSYVKEDSDSELEMDADELSSLSDDDSEINELLAESKWSTWC